MSSTFRAMTLSLALPPSLSPLGSLPSFLHKRDMALGDGRNFWPTDGRVKDAAAAVGVLSWYPNGALLTQHGFHRKSFLRCLRLDPPDLARRCRGSQFSVINSSYFVHGYVERKLTIEAGCSYPDTYSLNGSRRKLFRSPKSRKYR